MKHKLLLISILFSFYNSIAQTDSSKISLSNYRDKIFSVFNGCSLIDDELSNAIKTKNANDIEQKRIALLQCAGDGMKTLDLNKDYEGDASLKYSCKEVLRFYQQTAEYDIPQLRDFYKSENNFLNVKNEFEKKPVKKHSQSEIIAYNKEVKKNNEGVTKFNQFSDFIAANRKKILKDWYSGERIFMDAHRSRNN